MSKYQEAIKYIKEYVECGDDYILQNPQRKRILNESCNDLQELVDKSINVEFLGGNVNE